MSSDRRCRRPGRLASWATWLALVTGVVAACGVAAGPADVTAASASAPVSPEDRAAIVETTGCGHASATTGSGVVIDGGLVLTAAHVVASSSAIDIVFDEVTHEGELVAFDPARDLALVSIDDSGAPRPPSAGADVDSRGRIVGGAGSGTTEFSVRRVADVEIDKVRMPGTATRRAFELAADTERGDSGAGAYDGSGALVGIVFAVSTEHEGTTWVTAASEIDAFLSDESALGHFRCDENRSRRIDLKEQP